MPKRDVVGRIIAFNAGREPERLRLKYAAMYASAFRFLRGTCHLFYQDWPRHSVLNRAPSAWISGDLHLENFGTYKGDDRIIYFDINDFDESVLAPCTWEMTRLAASVLVAADDYGLRHRQALHLARAYIGACAEALASGKARRVERLVASGPIRELLETLFQRRRAALLRQRTERRGGRLRLRLGKRALPASAAQRRAVTALLGRFARRERNPGFFRVLDVARRVAGTGSLGLPRFVILVQGKGPPDGHYLLDLKGARPSALAKVSPCRQPRWGDQAQRVGALQNRLQAVSPALLHPVRMNGEAFLLRELQPSEDRLNLSRWGDRLDDFEDVMRVMGRVTAWSTLRSSGRQGSAIADELIAFAGRTGWRKALLHHAERCATRVEEDWQTFREAARQGRIPLAPGKPFLSDED